VQVLSTINVAGRKATCAEFTLPDSMEIKVTNALLRSQLKEQPNNPGQDNYDAAYINLSVESLKSCDGLKPWLFVGDLVPYSEFAQLAEEPYPIIDKPGVLVQEFTSSTSQNTTFESFVFKNPRAYYRQPQIWSDSIAVNKEIGQAVHRYRPWTVQSNPTNLEEEKLAEELADRIYKTVTFWVSAEKCAGSKK
jgi:hypothetical protein